VSECHILTKADACLLPSNVYPRLLNEAIFLREPQAIEWVVSTWPMKILRVFDVLPLEDTVDDDYLTVPFDSNEEVSLADCFVLGLLKLRPESNLKLVDFTRFEKGMVLRFGSSVVAFILPILPHAVASSFGRNIQFSDFQFAIDLFISTC